MTRPAHSHAPDALDLSLEASLRRQFEVPAPPPMPAEGFARLEPTPWYVGWGAALSSTLNTPLTIGVPTSLRSAAGLLLATSLWGGAAYIFYGHFQGAEATRAAHAGVWIPPIEADSPLGQALRLFESGAGPEVDEGSISAAQKQDELWARLAQELNGRLPEPLESQRFDEIRHAGGVTLLAIEEPETEQDLLFVSARIGDTPSVIVVEPTDSHRSSIVYGGFSLALAYVSAADQAEPQLFAARYDGGFGYELTYSADASLMRMLLPDMEVRTSVELRPLRYRAMRAISVEVGKE